MVDFRKLMSPEALAQHERRQAHMEKETKRLRAMSPEQLVKYAQLCLDNSAGPRNFPAGEPAYDNAVWHIVMPELIRRLGVVAAWCAVKEPSDLVDLQRQIAALGHELPYRTGGGSNDSLIYINPPVDEHGYPDDVNHTIHAAIDTSCAPSPEMTGRLVAALLNAAPNLLRLAALGKIVEEHHPEDSASDLVEKLEEAGAFR